MKTNKPFWSLLSKKEKAHLRKMGVRNIAKFDEVRAMQIKRDAEPGAMISCRDCRMIAKKTGRK